MDAQNFKNSNFSLTMPLPYVRTHLDSTAADVMRLVNLKAGIERGSTMRETKLNGK